MIPLIRSRLIHNPWPVIIATLLFIALHFPATPFAFQPSQSDSVWLSITPLNDTPIDTDTLVKALDQHIQHNYAFDSLHWQSHTQRIHGQIHFPPNQRNQVEALLKELPLIARQQSADDRWVVDWTFKPSEVGDVLVAFHDANDPALAQTLLEKKTP